MANYKVVAYQIGDLIKYSSTVNEINRAALSVCSFDCQDFSNFRNSITSERAYCYLCWVFSIANQKHLSIWDRNKKLISFTNLLLTTDQQEQANKIFVTAGILNESHEFDNRDYHKAIIDNCRKLFIETNYFHGAVTNLRVSFNQIKTRYLA